jgi:hypothetical protein
MNLNIFSLFTKTKISMKLSDFTVVITKCVNELFFLQMYEVEPEVGIKVHENLHCALLAVVRATALRALRALGHMSVGSSEG